MAVFGGTFDPVHFGHLRSAVEVRQSLGLDKIKLVPSRTPPHREMPGSTPQQRLEMVRRATRDAPGIEVDDREIRREGKSFMIDTLHSIRAEIGADVPLTLVIGFDAFTLLDSWRDWRSISDVAHLAVIERPGHAASEANDLAAGIDFESLSANLADFFRERFVKMPLCLHSQPGGLMCSLRLTRLDISSTQIREIIARGESPDYLMPSEVVRYIHEHGLYGAIST